MNMDSRTEARKLRSVIDECQRRRIELIRSGRGDSQEAGENDAKEDAALIVLADLVAQ